LVTLLGASLAMPAGAAMTTEQRLRALENLVHEQQQEIKALKGELKQQKAIGTATQQQAERAEESAKATDKKVVASIPDWVSKITPFGDVRYRHEGFYNQQRNKESGDVVHARNRERIRWRFGAKYAYSDELSATFRLASGDPNDPISTNETLTGDFSRKHVNLDWAYLTVAPGKTFGWRPGVFTINAGKFPNPMFRVGEMVFDDDLSPEGLNETVQLLGEPCGPLDQVKIHAQQWTLNEDSNGPDAWMFGGQINPQMHFGDVALEAGVGQYWWKDADLIAQAANTNSVIKQFTTNRVILDSDGDIEAFESGYNTTNLNIAATIANVAGGTMPLKIFGDYIYNWEAEHSDANGAMGGFRLGNPKEQGDWAASLLYEYLQRDATLGTFAWSDFGNGGTNEQGPVVAFDYQLFKPLTLTARSYFTKFIDPAPDIDNRMQVRLQLDAQLRF
jgi:hypothetical protein